MRNEEEVRELYKQYVYRFAIAKLDENKEKENIFFGAAFALGRTLNKDMKKIHKDFELAMTYLERLRKAGRQLPGYKEL